MKYLLFAGVVCFSMIFLLGCNKTDSATETSTTKETSEPSCNCSGNIYNCPDFSTHSEAQSLYQCCMAKVGFDVHGLDRDKDGSACETLP